MNMGKLIKKVSADTHTPRVKVRKIINSTVSNIIASLKEGEKVAFPKLGTFKVKTRRSRIGRNPKTGEKIQIVERKVAAFGTSPLLKKTLKYGIGGSKKNGRKILSISRINKYRRGNFNS